MFDPEDSLDERMAAEFGLKLSSFDNGIIPFFPKIDCDEEELKYSTDQFLKIRNAVHNAPNRRIDKRSLVANDYILVTLNLDTADRQLWQAGYSLRVRFAFDGQNIKSIDMCIKTSLGDGKVVQFNRGEWEASLKTLKPSMAEMIEQNRLRERPLPEFFKDGHIKDEEFLVESIGASPRNIYSSYEKFKRRGKTVLTAFQHTEDWKNIFMTPHADVVTTEDSEAEAEFLGFYNLTPDDISAAGYEELKFKAMGLLNRVILGADPSIHPNTIAKSVRGRNGLESVYGMPVHGLASQFDFEKRVHEATLFSLSQQVKPQDVNLENIWHNVARVKAQIERMMHPETDTFQPAKYRL